MTHYHYVSSLEVIRIAKKESPNIRYEVAVATRNPRLRYQILEILNRLKLKYVICSPDDFECEYAKAIITTEAEASRFDKMRLVIVNNSTKDEFIIPLMMKLNDIHNPTNVVFGIDPGMRFGLAFVVDGIAVHTKSTTSPSQAAETTIRWVHHIRNDFSQCQLLIRIGTGSRLYSILYLREILHRDNELAIELVDEQNTTRIGKSDRSSAILIAGRWGRSLGSNPDLTLEPKGGYIKSIKHLVSQLTEGNRSLSTEEAESIIKGKKPLNYFLTPESK